MKNRFTVPMRRSPGFDPKPVRLKLVEKKVAWAAGRDFPLSRPLLSQPIARTGAIKFADDVPRLPPGQNAVIGFPVLDLGYRPLISHRDWSLTIGGLCLRPQRIGYDNLESMGIVETRRDIHCVTGWSRLGAMWKGVPASHILDAAEPMPQAHYAIICGFDGYRTSMLLSDLRRDGVMFATHFNGRALTREHGGPVRLTMPHLYFWKSAKWVKQIWFTDQDPGGYWENRGYHRGGDPWKQQRFR